MPETKLVKPDLGYVKEVIAAGGGSLKQCYQCATCSVVCKVAGDDDPFPRRQMVLAQWGQRDALVNDPSIWRCHQCSDCTAYCPRDAKPGEVLGAIRRTAYRAHAVPAFMGALFASAGGQLVAFLIPVIVIAAMVALNNQPQTGSHLVPIFGGEGFMPQGGEIRFARMMPITTGVDVTFLAAAGLAILSAFASLSRLWRNLEAQVPASVPRKGFVPSLVEFLKEFLTHESFKKCTVNAGRTTGHLLLVYGFLGAFITTNIVLVYEWGTKFGVLHELETPLPFSGLGLLPKLIGNAAGLGILLGALLLVGNRMKTEKDNPASGYDWLFLTVVILVGATGMLAEILRLAGSAGLAYPMYFAHLVFVFYVIAYLPYSKLAHLLYRSLVLVHAKHVGRTPAA